MMQTLSVSNAPSFIDSTRNRAAEGLNPAVASINFASLLPADAVANTVNGDETSVELPMTDLVALATTPASPAIPVVTIAIPATTGQAIAGLPLPVAAGGKDLPVALPEGGKDAELPAAAPDAAEEIALAMIIPGLVGGELPAVVPAAAPLIIGTAQPTTDTAAAASTSPATLAAATIAGPAAKGNQAEGNAPQADTGTGGQAASQGRQQPAEAPAVMLEVAPAEATASVDPVDHAVDFTTGRTSAAPASPTLATSTTPSATQLSSVVRFQPAATLTPHDLAQVVERLAAAREAFAPAAAAIAIDHAEFGELSLRFEQRRDGQLAVQLAATDPEAHRAIVAAVAAERSNATGSQSGQPSMAGQHSGNSQAGDRTDGSGREGQGTAGRDDRNGAPRRNAAAHTSTTGRPSAQSGEILA